MAANSTVMYSGFNPNSRNSSKVLRPPGGGSSDIFGLKGGQEEEKVDPVQEDNDNVNEPTASQDNMANTTSNGEKAEEADIEPPAESNDGQPETGTTLPESSPSVTPLPSSLGDPSLAPPVAGVRGRIPPGGHSSGSFW